VNVNGTACIGYCRSSSSEFASIYYAFRNPGDPLGEMSPPLLIHAGELHYTGEGGSTVRWGDYSGTVVDPIDDTTFWHYNEYPAPANTNRWNTWVQEIITGATPGIFDIDIESFPITSFVPITVSPPDRNGDSDGVTPTTRTYIEDTTVSLTAPATYSGLYFSEWQLDGTPQTSNTTYTFDVTADATATAMFEARFDLSVESSPTNGALIEVTPIDNDGNGDGVTPFTRSFDANESVTLVAPATHDGRSFDKWVINGTDQPAGQTTVNFTMSTVSTATAEYADAPCDPCDMNCDGAVNTLDIEPFIDLLGGATPCSACAGDANGDGAINTLDIEFFIDCLTAP
jgi:hypothetical protein